MAKCGPRIGIIAIGRNEGDRLKRCLASVPPGIPVVYVDSASTDGSAEHAATSGATVVALDMTLPFTAARARAEGFAALMGANPSLTYVQFVDGDCEIETGWLDRATAFLDTNADAAVVCGRRRERFPDASAYNRICDIEWDTPVGEAPACGGDALMRIASYRAVGGFDPAVVAGEEPELCNRIRAAGGRVWRLDTPMTIHDAAMLHFSQWWKRAVRSGFGYAQVWHVRKLYGAELIRSFLWGAILPIGAILLAILFSPFWLLLLGLLLIQTARMALQLGGRRIDWIRAALLSAVKPAEVLGALRYFRQSRSMQVFAPTSYK